jgi:hypothetical protein
LTEFPNYARLYTFFIYLSYFPYVGQLIQWLEQVEQFVTISWLEQVEQFVTISWLEQVE